MDSEKKPKKARKKKSKPTLETEPSPTSVIQAQPEIPILTKEENAEFLDHINSYLQKKALNDKPKTEVDEFKLLQSHIGEYLESYISFGYTYDGQRVLIQHCTTPRDRDAILEFLKAVFIMNASKDGDLGSEYTDE